MLKQITAACLMSTALAVVPALAQTNGSHGANSTQDFVTKAAEGGMFEIQSSQLALKKSQDKDVRDFAQKMIDDHTKANDKLKSLAKNERVPASLDQEHQQMLSKLQGESGSNFADQFKQVQVSAHQQTIELFQNYANNGGDQPLKQFAQQTLPTLKDHLQMAQQITIASNGSQTMAQNTAQTTAAGAQNAGNRDYMTQQQNGVWRSSKMIGMGVYNEQNEKVGDINEMLFDRSGNVSAVVIGVGGFLGLGERNVAVPYHDLQWSMTPPNSRTAGNGVAESTGNPGGAVAPTAGLGNPASPVNPAPNMPATGNPGRTDVNTSQNPNPAYPDHAVLANASKDQLKNAPQFNYGSAPR